MVTYNIFAYKVMMEASRRAGFEFESEAYYDELAWYFGMSESLEREYRKPEEAMAYLAEKVQVDRGTEFARIVVGIMSELR